MSSFRLVLLVGAFLLAACSPQQSVDHLPYTRWESTAPQTVRMRYLLFRYQVMPMDDEVDVTAEACPLPDRFPDWAAWYGEIGLDIYITDENGAVLARESVVLPPRPLDLQETLPVQARFDLGRHARQPLFVAFGYRLTLTDAPPDMARRKVLASEAALER